MVIVIIRTLILFSLVLLVIRLMGKRQVGQMQPYEIGIIIMISALAAIPMEDTGIPLINTIIPILLIFSFQVILSFGAQKNERIRAFIDGRPSVLIKDGKIEEQELIKLRMNINDLLELLRIQGYANILDVETAVLENNGVLSVIPKSQNRPVTPKDLGLATTYEGLPYPLIIDGNINYENLTKIKQNEAWLKEQMANLGIPELNHVLFVSLDTAGNLYYQRKSH